MTLTGLVGLGVLAIVVASPTAQQNRAQIEQVKDNLYLIMPDTGARPGSASTTAAFVTANGVVVVDTNVPGWGQAILDQIRSVTDKPVTMIINTHTHFDHVGSNAEFSPSVEVVAHENTKTLMTGMRLFQGERVQYLPGRTFSDRMSLFQGEDQIDLYYFGRAHTNGDTIVAFPFVRAAHTGDLYAANSAPLVTCECSLEYAETLQRAVAGLPEIDTIMPGHSDVTDWQAFVDYAAFNRDLLAAVRQAFADGLTVEEAADSIRADARFAAFDLAPFGSTGQQMGGITRLVSQMYSELGR
jgi:glyoxylase-like metal-dependent hydrolase (beta-lactamase superfamily II)